MTITTTSSPVTSPSSPDSGEQPKSPISTIKSPAPAAPLTKTATTTTSELSFSVESLLAPSKKIRNDNLIQTTTTAMVYPSPTASPISTSYSFNDSRLRVVANHNNSDVPEAGRYILSHSPVSICDSRTSSASSLSSVSSLSVSPRNYHERSHSITSMMGTKSPITTPGTLLNNYNRAQSTQSADELQSRCSENDMDEDNDIGMDDEHDSDVDVEETNSAPVRPLPGYVGGFPNFANLTRLPVGLHPVWNNHPIAAAHQQRSVAANAAAASLNFYPSTFSHPAFNGEL